MRRQLAMGQTTVHSFHLVLSEGAQADIVVLLNYRAAGLACDPCRVRKVSGSRCASSNSCIGPVGAPAGQGGAANSRSLI